MNSKYFFSTATLVFLISLFFAVYRIEWPSQKSDSEDLRGRLEVVPLVDAIGPESFAFDSHGGGPYTGVSGGRILKWSQQERRWVDFAATSSKRDGCTGQLNQEHVEHLCGRPLGLAFDNATGDLYIADAYLGLLVVGPNGGLATEVVSQAQGLPFAFTNGLEIDHKDGVVYFTDSSSKYQRRNYMSVILSGDKTGRLMKYDPQTKQVTVLLENLAFANGVALSRDGNSLLISETAKCRIVRYWLKSPKAGTFEVFSELRGFPDNIKRSPRGGFWIGIVSRKQKLLEWILSYPQIGHALLRLPLNLSKMQMSLAKWRGSGMAVRVDEEGKIVERFEDGEGNRWRSITEVRKEMGSCGLDQ